MTTISYPKSNSPLKKTYFFPELFTSEYISNKLPLQNYTKLNNSTTLFGLELEIESILEPIENNQYWNTKSDHSLRNNGKEFVSIPLQGKEIYSALTYLKNQILLENTPTFSSRCSTHVHLNIRELTWNNIICLILYYSIFEKHFFNVAGTKREESIFCVPLYLSNHSNKIKNLVDTLNTWSKYNALNLGTILGSNHNTKFGTIEFRHLYGTLHIPTIMSWINTIQKLYDACQKTTVENLTELILTLNSTSEYFSLYKEIFEEEAQIDIMSKTDFESCITSTKIALTKDNTIKQATANSFFYLYINQE